MQSGKFNVTVIKRDSSTSSNFPESVTVKTADFSSIESATEAFSGQDAVVSTVGSAGVPGQPLLVRAAAAAGVKRFLPSDFGSDLANPKASALPVFKNKLATHAALREAAADANPDGFSWTSVCNGAFLDWGFEKGMLLNWRESKPKLFDGGESVFSTTTLDTIGLAVVGVLSHPQETRNRFVYVKDADVSQKQLLGIAQKVAKGKEWEEPVRVDKAAMEKSSFESLAKGEVTPPVMVAFLLRSFFGPAEYGGRFEKTDNELLGIKGKTEEEVEAVVELVMSRGN